MESKPDISALNDSLNNLATVKQYPEIVQSSEAIAVSEVTVKTEVLAEPCVEVKLEEGEISSDQDDSCKKSDTKSALPVTEGQSDDVPEDFFEDFLKDDFMAGLDIIDEDADDDLTVSKVCQESSSIESTNSPRQWKKEAKEKESRQTNEDNNLKMPKESARKTSKKLDRAKELKKLEKELGDLRKQDKQKADADSFDIRRDPEKTRQAIQRDKIKSAKDKEKRLITDIVQTGLVPPGMELEVDLKEVCNIEDDSKMPQGDLRAKLSKKSSQVRDSKQSQDRKSSSNSRKSSVPLKRKKSYSPTRKSRRHVEPESPQHRVSPMRNSVYKRRSPFVAGRIHSRNRSPLFNARRWSRSRSPVYRRSRSRNRSPVSRRRRDISGSPLSRRRRTRSPKRGKDEKMSFLEEIVAKLNEPVKGNYTIPNTPGTVPIPPAPFYQTLPTLQPPIVQAGTHAAPFEQYDESFFIGTGNQPPLNLPNPERTNGISNYGAALRGSDNITKRFGGARITVSDFLAMNSNSQVINASSEKLYEKIKVVQRCQEVVKLLDEKRFMAPVVVIKTDTYKYSNEPSVSPVLRQPVVHLPFTTAKSSEDPDLDFQRHCEMLLRRVGLQAKIGPMIKHESMLDEATASAVPPTREISTQTEKAAITCRECFRRKGILYAETGVQTNPSLLSFSISTQVNEADFYSMIPKNRSLASLTPAQLLGKHSMVPELNKPPGHLEGIRRGMPDVSRVWHVPNPPTTFHNQYIHDQLTSGSNHPVTTPSLYPGNVAQVRPGYSGNMPLYKNDPRGYSGRF